MVLLPVLAGMMPGPCVHIPARRGTTLPTAQLPEPASGVGPLQAGMDQNQAVSVS